MGQHKHNPTATAAKNGELPPKPPKMSKREQEALIAAMIAKYTGADKIKQHIANINGRTEYI